MVMVMVLVMVMVMVMVALTTASATPLSSIRSHNFNMVDRLAASTPAAS